MPMLTMKIQKYVSNDTLSVLTTQFPMLIEVYPVVNLLFWHLQHPVLLRNLISPWMTAALSSPRRQPPKGDEPMFALL